MVFLDTDPYTIKIALDEAGTYATSTGQDGVYKLNADEDDLGPLKLFGLEVGTVHELWSLSPGTQPFPAG